MHKNVLDYEPDIALFVPNDDPLIYYRYIAKWAKDALKSDGSLYFEINEFLGDDVVELLKEEGYVLIEQKKDYAGKDRMVRAKLNE